MRKKDIIAMLSLVLVSGGFVVGDIHDYNSQSQALLEQKVDLEKYKTIYERVNEIVEDFDEKEREEYVQQKVEELRAEKERIRLEEERKRQEEEERRKQEELYRQQQEQNSQVVNRGGDIENKVYCKFEVSFYTTSPDEGSGTGLGASGVKVTPWQSIALPKEIPFFSEVYIEGLGTFINHDTGSYISSYYDEQGNKVYRCDVLVNSKEEAYSLGRQYRSGWIEIKN